MGEDENREGRVVEVTFDDDDDVVGDDGGAAVGSDDV